MIPTLISRLFDPFLMITVVFVCLLWNKPVFIPALLSMVLLPFLFYFLAWKTERISNWDMSNRSERPKILWTLVAIEIVGFFVFQLWMVFPILLAVIGFTVITHFWKISGHAMSAALASGAIILRFGWNVWPVILIVPLVGWARVVRKDHSIAQIVAGAFYSWSLLLVVARYFILLIGWTTTIVGMGLFSNVIWLS